MNDKQYTKNHEWLSLKDEVATIGITNFAQESLGDIVFVELPKIGKLIKKGDQIGVVESVKAASDLLSPISGEIIEINTKLKNSPQLVNEDSENLLTKLIAKGWLDSSEEGLTPKADF